MKSALQIGWILLCLTLALGARSWNIRNVFIDGKIYFVDADCYSRMSRAAIVAENPGAIIRHHDFENWPQGTTPHTTAPLDYTIVGLKSVLDLGFAILDRGRTSMLHDQTLDLAGAVVSPLLGLAGTLSIGLWGWFGRVRYGGMMVLFYAISPILVHGTLLGRPDHQSLLIFLLTIAGITEMVLSQPPVASGIFARRRAWGIVGGIAWGLSLWVSLYEPLILLVAVCALRCIADRRTFWSPDRRAGTIACLAVVALFLLVEGWRVGIPDAADRARFALWSRTIGELTHLGLGSTAMFGWLGWPILASPVLLFLARKFDRRALPLLCVLVVTLALSVWQVRWGYFLALAFAFALPWQMQVFRRAWLSWALFVVGLWPLLREWDTTLYSEQYEEDRAAMQRIEIPALRDLVSATAGRDFGGILAPWWLSPSVAYWSRTPCVAGSSHESLPGIVDTARFFLSETPEAAAPILKARRVGWVLADAPPRVIATSTALLDTPAPLEPLANILMDHPDELPEFLREFRGAAGRRADGVRFYRLYRVDDAKLPP